jgi:hypothetical protein
MSCVRFIRCPDHWRSARTRCCAKFAEPCVAFAELFLIRAICAVLGLFLSFVLPVFLLAGQRVAARLFQYLIGLFHQRLFLAQFGIPFALARAYSILLSSFLLQEGRKRSSVKEDSESKRSKINAFNEFFTS